MVQTPDGPVSSNLYEAWLTLPLSMQTGPLKKWTKAYFKWYRKASLAAVKKKEDAATHVENGLIALLESEVADGWRHCRASGQKDL